MDPRAERRSLIAAAGAGVVLLAVGGMALAGLKRVDRREHCLWNLSRIGMAVIAAEPTDAAGWDKIGTGRRFFREFADWPGRQPVTIDPRWFCCPGVGPAVPGRIDYRGPANPLRNMQRDDPIAADQPGNHGGGEGGNVVLRSGAVKSVAADDPAWVRANTSTWDGGDSERP